MVQRTLRAIIKIFRLLCNVLLTSGRTKDVKKNTKTLLNMVKRTESLEDKELNESAQGVHEEDNFDTTMRAKSPFYI